MKNNVLLIEPHYLGSIEYFAQISKYTELKLEVHDHFIKQTYRNRSVILGANGQQNLIVPVIFGNRTIYKDVTIDYHQSWLKDHIMAVKSAYGKSPYFDHFFQYFINVWENRYRFLLDLCMEMVTLCLDLLKIDIKISKSEEYLSENESYIKDMRNIISSKISYDLRNIYKPSVYLQNFGNKFVPNLSILDTLMCVGLEASDVIYRSTRESGEQL